jgi:hypothetical protein
MTVLTVLFKAGETVETVPTSEEQLFWYRFVVKVSQSNRDHGSQTVYDERPS